jgi:hypothetical protein
VALLSSLIFEHSTALGGRRWSSLLEKKATYLSSEDWRRQVIDPGNKAFIFFIEVASQLC